MKVLPKSYFRYVFLLWHIYVIINHHSIAWYEADFTDYSLQKKSNLKANIEKKCAIDGCYGWTPITPNYYKTIWGRLMFPSQALHFMGVTRQKILYNSKATYVAMLDRYKDL